MPRRGISPTLEAPSSYSIQSICSTRNRRRGISKRDGSYCSVPCNSQIRLRTYSFALVFALLLHGAVTLLRRASGRIPAAIIDFGGSLGVGTRKDASHCLSYFAQTPTSPHI